MLPTLSYAVEHFDYGFSRADNARGGGELENYVSQQFWAETDIFWLSGQMRLELSQGEIFQHELGSAIFGVPHPMLIQQDPSLEFDTYVGRNDAMSGLVAGGAVNLGGGGDVQFDRSVINVAWTTNPGQLESGLFMLAMVTLSDDANGRGAIWLGGGAHPTFFDDVAHMFKVTDGVMRLYGAPLPPAVLESRRPGLEGPPDVFQISDTELEEIFYESIEGMPVQQWLTSYSATTALPFDPLDLRISRDGSASLETELLSDAAVTELVSTGNWVPRGSQLVFSSVPEPGTLWLSGIVAAVVVGYARLRGGCAGCRRQH